MTLYGWGNPRYFPRLPPPTPRFFDVEPEARVLAHCHWQAQPWEHPTIIALHGLNGSSDAHYMRGIAAKAFARGMNVVRLNQRNCGGTEHLSAGLFHSGLTADARHVIEELMAVDGLPSIAVAGYSLGGNLALKLAGEYGHAPPSGVESRGGGLTDSRDLGVRPRARAAWQLALSVELRPRSQGPDAAQGSVLAGPIRSVAAQGRQNRPPVRRGVHRAALRIRRRRRLLPSCQRHARDRSLADPGPRHDVRRRSVCAFGAVSRSARHRKSVHLAVASRPTAGTADSSARRRPTMTGTGPKRRWSRSSSVMRQCDVPVQPARSRARSTSRPRR